MDREIRILLDERAISDVMHGYCHAMDGGQAEAWLDCFTSDARFDVRLPDGGTYVHLEGQADLVRFAGRLRSQPGHKHVYAAPVFRVDVDAGEAEVTSYFLTLSGDGQQAGIGSFGRTRDRFVKRDGHWKIRERLITTDGMAPALPSGGSS